MKHVICWSSAPKRERRRGRARARARALGRKPRQRAKRKDKDVCARAPARARRCMRVCSGTKGKGVLNLGAPQGGPRVSRLTCILMCRASAHTRTSRACLDAAQRRARAKQRARAQHTTHRAQTNKQTPARQAAHTPTTLTKHNTNTQHYTTARAARSAHSHLHQAALARAHALEQRPAFRPDEQAVVLLVLGAPDLEHAHRLVAQLFWLCCLGRGVGVG